MHKCTFWIACTVVIAFSISVIGKTVNLIPNPGFEKVNKQKITGWHQGRRLLKGSMGISNDEKHSGKNAAYIKSAKQSLSVNSRPIPGFAFSTDYLPSPPSGTLLECASWIKTKDIVSNGKWFKCRLVIYFYDRNKKKLKHYDLITLTGTNPWQQYKNSKNVPENAVYMKLSLCMSNCTGEVWFDDIEVNINETAQPSSKQAMANLPTDRPVLIPTPIESVFHKSKIIINGISFKSIPGDKRARSAFLKLMDEYKIKVTDGGKIKLIFCDKNNSQARNAFKTSFPKYNWHDLGKQGYFIIAKKNKIFLGANSEKGRFYATQTLRQLLRRYNGKALDSVSIFDKPTVSKRGVVIGLQWFAKRQEAIKRLTQLKLNRVWHQGSFLNLKLGCNHKTLKTHWREDFTENQINLMKNYVELCRKNFIEVCVAFSPRGKPPTHYSSAKDIDLLVGKMVALYEVGVHNLSVSFDDLQNIEQDRLFYADDIKKFKNNLAIAHAYFCDQIYRKLKAKCPDVIFGVLPYAYSGLGQMPDKGKRSKSYLKLFSSGLSSKITQWVVCLYSISDIKNSNKITGRKPFIWDNFYTTGILPVFPVPIKRSSELSDSNISGYMFLPAVPTQEDESKISWMNAADYMWSPARYDAEKSYSNAIAYVAGSQDAIKLIEAYSRFSLKIDDYNFPTENKEKRIAFLSQALAKLSSYPDKLSVLPPTLSKAINKDIIKYKKNLTKIINNLNERPYPVLIKKRSQVEFTDANALKNFIPIKKQQRIKDSKVWFAYDKKMLYIKVICDEDRVRKLLSKRNKRDSNVFQDDSVEFFIMPEPENSIGNSTYYQIVINPKGTIYDSKFVHKKFNYLKDQYLNWTVNAKVKTKINQKSWQVEIEIPFTDLGMTAPSKGEKIFFNICRNRYAGKPVTYSCYALLFKGYFHDPASFWPLQFD